MIYLQSLLGGLISFISPVVFLIFLFVWVAFSRFTRKERKAYIGLFSLLVIAFYQLFVYLTREFASNIFLELSEHYLFNVLVLAIHFSIGLWIIGLFHKVKSPELLQKTLLSLFVTGLALSFSLSSVSGIGPILGTLLVYNASEPGVFIQFLPVLVFCIGLLTPITLILWFTGKLCSKWNEKKGWNITRMILGGLFILINLLGQFMQ
jgi:cytochrome c biogenesis protein CcdA